MIKVVLFDLDDTLFPESSYIKTGFKCVEQYIECKYNITIKKGFLYELFEVNPSRVYNRALEELSIVYCKSDITELIEVYRSHFPKGIELYEDANNILKVLDKMPIRLGIITDGRPIGQANKIKALGLDKLIDKIIITDELGGEQFRKPCPKAFEMMKDYFAVEYSEMVYVGDNPAKDFAIKQSYDINAIRIVRDGLYSTGEYLNGILPDDIIYNLEELLNKDKNIICEVRNG